MTLPEHSDYSITHTPFNASRHRVCLLRVLLRLIRTAVQTEAMRFSLCSGSTEQRGADKLVHRLSRGVEMV